MLRALLLLAALGQVDHALTEQEGLKSVHLGVKECERVESLDQTAGDKAGVL